jgi:hypothetical protein
VATLVASVTNGKDAPPSKGDLQPRGGDATQGESDRSGERIALGYALEERSDDILAWCQREFDLAMAGPVTMHEAVAPSGFKRA